jgi:hypothetical protein
MILNITLAFFILSLPEFLSTLSGRVLCQPKTVLSVARKNLCFILMRRTDLKVTTILHLHKIEGDKNSISAVLIKKPLKTCKHLRALK